MNDLDVSLQSLLRQALDARAWELAIDLLRILRSHTVRVRGRMDASTETFVYEAQGRIVEGMRADRAASSS